MILEKHHDRHTELVYVRKLELAHITVVIAAASQTTEGGALVVADHCAFHFSGNPLVT